MGKKTAIEWADATWNPWYGCSKVSLGCDNCYAEREMKRWGKDFNEVSRAAKSTFYAPLAWKEPNRIFTCSWSDFFIKKADPWREEAWKIIKATPQHTYMILTKRPGLMAYWAETHPWPEHVWAGVSVETQKYAPRIDVLARVPAKVRFVSAEPLLGFVDLRPHLYKCICDDLPCTCEGLAVRWCIVGGESGPGCRPMDTDWVRFLRDQCRDAGVSFFYKQCMAGARKISTPFLDGRRWTEYPMAG